MRYLFTLGLLLVVACSTSIAANFCSGDGTTSCAVDADCSGVGGYCGVELKILVPLTAVPDLLASKAEVVASGAVKADTTNQEFAVFLIRRGIGQDIVAQAQSDGDTARQISIDTTLQTARSNFPNPLRPAVCGDGEVDPNEQCDDGGSNSDTVADACRTRCRDAFCGDGVVDTGEVCDDRNDGGCLPDCSGVAP